jgi:ribosomal protein S18 acetylase RimI-like enzyme
MDLKWRLADIADLDELNELVNKAYRGSAGWTNEHQLVRGQRTNKDELKTIIDNQGRENQVILVFSHLVFASSTLVAAVLLEQKDDNTAYLGMLSVAPSHQQLGIGAKILTVSADYIIEKWGIHKIEITVIKQRTELISWYEHHGYSKTGTMVPFPYDNPSVGKPLRDDLEFVVLVQTLQRSKL